GTGSDKIIAIPNGKMILAPRQYAIILDSDYFSNSMSYQFLIPSTALILTIDNSTFGSGGLSNSTAENVTILDSLGNVICSYQYSLGNPVGHSDEKIILEGDNSPENWANSLCPHGTPGFQNSVYKFDYDLALVDSVQCYPLKPGTSESITLRIPVINCGIREAEKFELLLFHDRNSDSIGLLNEKIDQKIYDRTISPGEKSWIEFDLNDFPAGLNQIILILNYTVDQNLSNNQIIYPLKIHYAFNTLLITEIMYYPFSDAPEWIEIYNPGELAIDLKDWLMSDSRKQAAVPIQTNTYFIQPDSFVVIAANANFLEHYASMAEKVIIISKTWPTLNNSGDKVFLYDFSGFIIDSLAYSSEMGYVQGSSLERDRTLEPGQKPFWALSTDKTGATLGRGNSCWPAAIDFNLKKIAFNPPRVKADSPLTISVIVKNDGVVKADFHSLFFFDDLNQNRLMEREEFIQELEGISLVTGDSIVFSINWIANIPGKHFPSVRLNEPADQKLENNFIQKSCFIGFPEKSLIINEYFAQPALTQIEWIELYNPTIDAINLLDWSVTDFNPKNQMFVNQEYLIGPGEFCIITEDSLFLEIYPFIKCPVIVDDDFPDLNNDEDVIRLKDGAGFMIDSLFYRQDWPAAKGKSVERVFWQLNSGDKHTWKICQAEAGATPGAVNSIDPNEIDLEVIPASILLTPATITTNDSIQILLNIQNAGKLTIADFAINFYHHPVGDSNFQVLAKEMKVWQTLAAGEFLQIEAMLPPSPSGRRLLQMELSCAGDLNPVNNRVIVPFKVGYSPGCVIINEIMYNPFSGQNEWIEFYNPGEQPVDLTEWAISNADKKKKSIKFPDPIFLNPQNYVIITEDSSFLDDWPEVSVPVLVTSTSFPSLNNESDQIWIYDLVGLPMDSVFYSAAWGNSYCISLERIRPDRNSTDPANWSACVAAKGGTPGRQNSLFVSIMPSTAKLTIEPNPFSPDQDNFEDEAIITWQLPMETAHVNLKIYDARGRLIRTLLNAIDSGANCSVIWDGMDDQRQRARMGIYIVFLEALNERKGIITQATQTVVLAHKL
ncbi:lamin tail domain-containing protein, partial [candidate division KSB1 bacterium]|nr:lamin tail domain-containing protein [candidate division KSB1 bacterium]